MTLTKEEIEDVKAQLSAQIRHLPEPQKTEAQNQINALSPEAVEQLVKEQKQRKPSQNSQKGIFRMIVDKEVPSAIVDENKQTIAVLEINPISKGHTIIIPKKSASDTKTFPNQGFSLAKKISKKIISKLKAESTEIQTENKFGEVIINIIPVYDSDLSINSPRYKASKEELDEVAKKLQTTRKPKSPKPKPSEQKPSEPGVIKWHRKIPSG